MDAKKMKPCSLFMDTERMVSLGYQAGLSHTSGSDNTLIGGKPARPDSGRRSLRAKGKNQ